MELFVPLEDAAEVEAIWRKVEDRLDETWAQLDTGEVIPPGSRAELALQDCLALHWARSKSVRTLHESMFTKVRAEVRRELVEALPTRLIDQLGVRQSGITPAGAEGRNMVVERALQGSPELQFGKRVAGYFRVAQARNRSHRIEVYDCAPGTTDLRISDCPVLSPNVEGTALNPRQGSGLGVAVAMPLGPRVAICLLDAEQPTRRRINAQEVNTLNVMQEQAADRYLWRRP